MRVVAVDWSGSRNPAYQRRHIWRADAVDGEITLLRGGRTRDEVVTELLEQAANELQDLVVGFDFGFSVPRWYLDQLGHTAPDLWALLAAEALTPTMATIGLAAWIEQPEPPFWNRTRSPATAGREFRRTELEHAALGVRPQSVFQLVGAGQVGRSSLYGMQALHRLRAAGFAIWPFDAPVFPLAIEIYPRLLIGNALTNTEAARAAYLAELPIDPEIRAAAIGSVDAFDALVSGLRMHQHQDEFSRLGADSVDRLEGKIWAPFTASEVTGAGTDDVVVTYLAAWNEPDTDRRMTLLASACDADVRYVDPEADVTGLEALSGVIASFQAAYPGHILRLASDVDAHHDVLRFAWLVERPDGAALSAGLDACSRAPDGRLVLIAGFFDAL